MTGGATGRVDAAGRLVSADQRLLALQQEAGGAPHGPIAVSQIARLVAQARRLGLAVVRPVRADDGSGVLDLLAQAAPDGDGVDLAISDRVGRPSPAATRSGQSEWDGWRSAADWYWNCDERLTLGEPPRSAPAMPWIGAVAGRPLTALLRLIEERDGALPILAAAAGQHGFESQIAELRDAPGRLYRLSGTVRTGSDGRFLGFDGTAVRIGEGEGAAKPASAPIAGDLFGGRVGDALRRPLDRIVGEAERICAVAEGALRSDYLGYAADIITAARHLRALTEDLADLQAAERPSLTAVLAPFDLAEVARAAAGLLAVPAAERGIQLAVPDAEKRAMALGEARRALQIIVNLLGNAIRHSPAGGTVTLSVLHDGDLAAAIVADDGDGIDGADQARIFDRFVRLTRAEGGSGLGLYIARRFARAMQGDLDVLSAPGEGARFVLSLPAA